MAGASRTEVIPVPIKDIFAVVADFEKYPEFVTGVKSARVLESSNGGKRVALDMEMMKRIQYTIDVKESLDEAAGAGSVKWTLAQSEFFKANNGSWTFKALGPSQTEVVYQLDLDFKIAVPGFILKGMIANALPMAIKEFAKRAESRVKDA